MSRLYGITYNEKQWSCKKNSISYIFVSKETFNIYKISADIIGIEQITFNSFLVYRRISKDKFQISHVVFDAGYIDIIFSEDFKHFYFLSEDTILFDNSCVYSISRHCRVPEFQWLKDKDLEVINNEDKNSTYLFVKQHIPYTDNDYVQVFVDGITFKPITHASSSLRNNHNITLSDKFTFDNLFYEDVCYARFIFYRILDMNESIVKSGTETLMEELLQITTS